MQTPTEAQRMADQLTAAKTREDLGLLYVEWVGYNIAEDDAEATFENLHALMLGYIAEHCAQTGEPLPAGVPEAE